MSKNSLLISYEQKNFKDGVISMKITEGHMEVETVGYVLVEALGVFLSDLRANLHEDDVELYNEYVKDLHDDIKKSLIHNYKNE